MAQQEDLDCVRSQKKVMAVFRSLSRHPLVSYQELAARHYASQEITAELQITSCTFDMVSRRVSQSPSRKLEQNSSHPYQIYRTDVHARIWQLSRLLRKHAHDISRSNSNLICGFEQI